MFLSTLSTGRPRAPSPSEAPSLNFCAAPVRSEPVAPASCLACCVRARSSIRGPRMGAVTGPLLSRTLPLHYPNSKEAVELAAHTRNLLRSAKRRPYSGLCRSGAPPLVSPITVLPCGRLSIDLSPQNMRPRGTFPEPQPLLSKPLSNCTARPTRPGRPARSSRRPAPRRPHRRRSPAPE